MYCISFYITLTGLNMLDLIHTAAVEDDETLQVQCERFTDSMSEDDSMNDEEFVSSHLSAFNSVFSKVSQTIIMSSCKVSPAENSILCSVKSGLVEMNDKVNIGIIFSFIGNSQAFFIPKPKSMLCLIQHCKALQAGWFISGNNEKTIFSANMPPLGTQQLCKTYFWESNKPEWIF